jgi:hypothetical protein
MANSRRIPRRPVSLALQLAHLGQRWPGLRFQIRLGVLTGEGLVSPNPLSMPYLVGLTYALGSAPRVFVKEPAIQAFRGEDLVPHVYDPTTAPRPCLYYPDGREWHDGMLLATTIMPWLLLWLTFYELWLATGVWLGSGTVHGPGKK